MVGSLLRDNHNFFAFSSLKMSQKWVVRCQSLNRKKSLFGSANPPPYQEPGGGGEGGKGCVQEAAVRQGEPYKLQGDWGHWRQC